MLLCMLRDDGLQTLFAINWVQMQASVRMLPEFAVLPFRTLRPAMQEGYLQRPPQQLMGLWQSCMSGLHPLCWPESGALCTSYATINACAVCCVLCARTMLA